MKAIDIFKIYKPDLLPNNPIVLGEGVGGIVFIINNKAVKFSALHGKYECIASDKAINLIIKNNYTSFAKIFSHINLGRFNFQEINWELYITESEILNKITDDEVKVFHTILSHEDKNIKKNYSILEIKKILSKLSTGLDFDEKKIIFFCDNLKPDGIIHPDIHPRNIMKNNDGYFKLIDFDYLNIGD